MIPTLRLLTWRTARQLQDRYVSTFRRRGPSDSRLLEVGVSLDSLIKESSKRSSFGSAQGSPLYGIFDIPQQRFAKCRGVVLHVFEDLAHRVSIDDGIDLPSAPANRSMRPSESAGDQSPTELMARRGQIGRAHV